MTVRHALRGLVRTGAFLLGLALATNSWAQGMYYKEIRKDGRIYVFNTAAEAERFEKSGETGRAITKLNHGPNGETVIFDSEQAIDLFNFKYGISQVVERPKPPKMDVIWRDGKTRITTDKAYMEISNRIQVRFTDVMPDDAVKLAGTEQAGDSKGSFRIRRMKFKIEGWFYKPELEYEVQLNWMDASTSQPNRFVEDANIDWDVSKNKTFRVRFGQFKAPYGRQQLTSSGAQQFVDRADTDGRYNPGRETGLALWGTLGTNKLDWRVMVSNGNARSQSENDNSKYLYSARAMWQLFGGTRMNQWASGALLSEGDMESTDKPMLAVAGNFLNNSFYYVTDKPATNLANTQLSGDYTFKYKGFASVGEYHYRKSKPEAGDQFKDKGFMVQASYAFKTPKLGPGSYFELAGRYGEIDPTDLKTNDKRTEIGGAVSYYYNRHNLKIQADFRQVKDEAKKAGEQKTQELRVQTQLIF